ADWYSYLYPTVTTTYTINATSVCGGPASATFTVHVEQYPSIISGGSTICQGDSTPVHISGLSGLSVTPNTGVNIVNDSLVELSPDSTTQYYISGYSACTGFYST